MCTHIEATNQLNLDTHTHTYTHVHYNIIAVIEIVIAIVIVVVVFVVNPGYTYTDNDPLILSSVTLNLTTVHGPAASPTTILLYTNVVSVIAFLHGR